MTSKENVTAIITVEEVCNHHLYGAIKCMNSVINEEIPEPADVAYIMEVMTKVAQQQRFNKEGETVDDLVFKLKLDEKSAVCIWHCLNIALANGMISQQGQQVFVSQLLSKIAIKLDQIMTLMQTPNELIEKPTQLAIVKDEHKPTPAPLQLVED